MSDRSNELIGGWEYPSKYQSKEECPHEIIACLLIDPEDDEFGLVSMRLNCRSVPLSALFIGDNFPMGFPNEELIKKVFNDFIEAKLKEDWKLIYKGEPCYG